MEDDPEPEPIENQQSMTSSNQQPIGIEYTTQRKFPPNFSVEMVANEEVHDSVEEQSYVLLETESGNHYIF